MKSQSLVVSYLRLPNIFYYVVVKDWHAPMPPAWPSLSCPSTTTSAAPLATSAIPSRCRKYRLCTGSARGSHRQSRQRAPAPCSDPRKATRNHKIQTSEPQNLGNNLQTLEFEFARLGGGWATSVRRSFSGCGGGNLLMGIGKPQILEPPNLIHGSNN
jgi:hypothetical protein